MANKRRWKCLQSAGPIGGQTKQHMVCSPVGQLPIHRLLTSIPIWLKRKGQVIGFGWWALACEYLF